MFRSYTTYKTALRWLMCAAERERECVRDGWILWADVYEVWTKWSEKPSSWRRTRSRVGKKMGDSLTHITARPMPLPSDGTLTVT